MRAIAPQDADLAGWRRLRCKAVGLAVDRNEGVDAALRAEPQHHLGAIAAGELLARRWFVVDRLGGRLRLEVDSNKPGIPGRTASLIECIAPDIDDHIDHAGLLKR